MLLKKPYEKIKSIFTGLLSQKKGAGFRNNPARPLGRRRKKQKQTRLLLVFTAAAVQTRGGGGVSLAQDGLGLGTPGWTGHTR